eukprot:Pgem_evm1s11834
MKSTTKFSKLTLFCVFQYWNTGSYNNKVSAAVLPGSPLPEHSPFQWSEGVHRLGCRRNLWISKDGNDPSGHGQWAVVNNKDEWQTFKGVILNEYNKLRWSCDTTWEQTRIPDCGDNCGRRKGTLKIKYYQGWADITFSYNEGQKMYGACNGLLSISTAGSDDFMPSLESGHNSLKLGDWREILPQTDWQIIRNVKLNGDGYIRWACDTTVERDRDNYFAYKGNSVVDVAVRRDNSRDFILQIRQNLPEVKPAYIPSTFIMRHGLCHSSEGNKCVVNENNMEKITKAWLDNYKCGSSVVEMVPLNSDYKGSIHNIRYDNTIAAISTSIKQKCKGVEIRERPIITSQQAMANANKIQDSLKERVFDRINDNADHDRIFILRAIVFAGLMPET